jgi:hypothetical protein
MSTPLWTQSGDQVLGEEPPRKFYRVEWNCLTSQRSITGFLSHSPPPYFTRKDTKVCLNFYSKKLSNPKTNSLWDNQKLLSLKLSLIDLLHVFIQKCKSRIKMHVKDNHWRENSPMMTTVIPLEGENIYLFSPDLPVLTRFQVLYRFTLATLLQSEHQT